jgi:hypothetical protein
MYLLDLGVEVEIVPVPDWSADLALDPLEEGGLAGRLVPQPHLQAERRPVHHLYEGFTKKRLKQLSQFIWFYARLSILLGTVFKSYSEPIMVRQTTPDISSKIQYPYRTFHLSCQY